MEPTASVAADAAPSASESANAPQPYVILGESPAIPRLNTQSVDKPAPIIEPDEIEAMRDMRDAMEHVILRYRAALREMEVRFEILDEDLNIKKKRNPIHHIESRIKEPDSILEKLDRYGKERSIANVERYIMDIAGVRIICSYISDVYNLFELLQQHDDLEIVTVKDYIAHPKPNGYRSLHVIVRIPVYFMDKKELVPVEVQMRTVAMDFWASLEHDLKYKSVREIQGIDAYDELKDCSRIIEDVEARMQILARALEVDDAAADNVAAG